MSIVTGAYGMKVQLNDGSTSGHLLGSTPQAEQNLSISGAAVDGSVPVLTTAASVAGGWKTFVWKGQQMVKAIDHGSGIQWAFTFTMSGGPLTWFPPVLFAPTEQGSALDGLSLDVCSSRAIYRGKVGANRCIRVTNAAHWLPPGRQSAPVAVNTTVLCDAYALTDTVFGALGSDQIIKNTMVITIPNGGGWQDQKHGLDCPWVFFGLFTLFTVFERLNTTTGVLTVVDPGHTTTGVQNNTEPYVISNADGSIAVCMYMPPAAMGPYGVYVLQLGNDTCAAISAQAGEEFPTGVPPGPRTYESFLIFGTRLSVVDQMVNVVKPAIG